MVRKYFKMASRSIEWCCFQWPWVTRSQSYYRCHRLNVRSWRIWSVGDS